MTGTDASLRITEHGFAVLSQPFDLQPTASGTWVDTGLQVTLPGAGVYHLDASVHSNLLVNGAIVNVGINARLWDVTAGAVLPGSGMVAYQVYQQQADPTDLGGNNTASLSVEYSVPGPRTIRLEADRTNIASATRQALIAQGTTLRFHRVA